MTGASLLPVSPLTTVGPDPSQLRAKMALNPSFLELKGWRQAKPQPAGQGRAIQGGVLLLSPLSLPSSMPFALIGLMGSADKSAWRPELAESPVPYGVQTVPTRPRLPG